MARLQRAEELRRRRSRRTTGSCRSTPTSGSRRRWRAEIQPLLARGAAARGYRVPRISHYLGRWIRGTDWYPDYQLRLYDRRAGEWNGRRVHESVAARHGRAGTAARTISQHYAYRDISAPPRDDRSLHDARRRADGTRTGGRRRSPASRSIRRSRSCATTSCAAASRTARAGFIVSVAELVLRVPETGEALGARQPAPTSGSEPDRRSDPPSR